MFLFYYWVGMHLYGPYLVHGTCFPPNTVYFPFYLQRHAYPCDCLLLLWSILLGFLVLLIFVPFLNFVHKMFCFCKLSYYYNIFTHTWEWIDSSFFFGLLLCLLLLLQRQTKNEITSAAKLHTTVYFVKNTKFH